jgi:hypothetical protein
MYASFPTRKADVSSSIRWFARVSSIVLMVIWLAFFVSEFWRPGYGSDVPYALPQGVALAIVFAGYFVGWWKELAGGLLAIAGTILFCALIGGMQGVSPGADILFAVPGILYLLGYYLNSKRIEQLKL